MTNEELERFQRIERTLEFIVENQAQFDAKMQQLEEQHQRFQKQHQKIQEQHQKAQNNLDRIIVQHAGLEDVVLKLAQSHVDLVNSHKALAEAGKRTDERLDAFITFVEKYISSRNGGERLH